MSTDPISRLRRIDAQIHFLSQVNALLGWDQETYMPKAGLADRGEQLALIDGLAHERLCSAEIKDILSELGVDEAHPQGSGGLHGQQGAYLRAFYRAWARANKLPQEFVEERAKAASASQAAWAEARQRNDFKAFLPHLSAMVGLARREADYLGYAQRPYDGLLDTYEPGCTEAGLRKTFDRLRAGLVELLSKISSRPQPDDLALQASFPASLQADFSSSLLMALPIHGDQLRLDQSEHPFTTTIGFRDVRITTRYVERKLCSSIFSTIHEAGHAMYELGLPEDWKWSMAGDAASIAIHESQSRLWENIIGRSLPFWKGFYESLQHIVSPRLSHLSVEDFYRAINRVEPSLIRVDADEVSYSLHVILRFELEAALISGALEPAGLPEAWDQGMRRYLSLTPPNDAQGCLQDIHWSMGAFGYFPSYALGNLYSAQFRQGMLDALGSISNDLESFDYSRIASWLRENIHSKGSLLTPGELIQEVTGSPLTPEYFLNYLNIKYGQIYGF